MWAILAFVVGVTVVAHDRLDAGGEAGDQVVSGPDGAVGTSTTVTEAALPGPGQVRVQGTASAVHLEGAVLDPRRVPTPLTVVSDRGFGNGGELTGVVVDGKPSTVVWDGGRPFALTTGGALVLGPVVADLAPDGVHLVLGGGAHELTPGTYQLDTPVAVGSSGIATPRDSVVFQATSHSLFEAHGDAGIVLGPDASRHLLGPGRVVLAGALELTDAAGTRSATGLSIDHAAFDLTLTPDGIGGWRIAGVVDRPAGP